MSEKIICPWCGAEMVRDGEALARSNEVAVWMRCISCGASSPLIKGHQTTNLENLYNMAHAAALRRYTPPLKPMTLEELITTNGEVYMDGKYNTKIWACRCFDNFSSKTVTVYYITMDAEVLNFESYGRVWRCWERKPTDEERSAAKWL